jgi:hypothetical protein
MYAVTPLRYDMLPIKDAECSLQIGDVCCSLRFDYPAVLPNSILTSMIEVGDIAGASLSAQVCSKGVTVVYRVPAQHSRFGIGLHYEKTKGGDMERMEQEEYHKPKIVSYDQNRCLLSGAGAIRWSMLHTKTGSLACTRQIEHDAPNMAAR